MNLYSGQTVNSTQRNQRSIRPQVPLFHSNTTGNIQVQHVINFDNLDMGGTGTSTLSSPQSLLNLTMCEGINVAYDGTFGDLSSTGASLFNVNEDYDFHQFTGGNDGFTPINAASDGMTVSPQDVFNNDSFPPSTSFTNLTTPGSTFLDTPEEDYETSPLFSDNIGAHDHWYPLFPESNAPAPQMMRTTSTSSTGHIVVHPGGEGNRKRNSMASPAVLSPTVKYSDVAGVNARKRDKPLPPIIVNENDTVALKRARNTAAARKSRAKKVAEKDGLEEVVTDLKAQVEHWKSIAISLGATEELSDD